MADIPNATGDITIWDTTGLLSPKIATNVGDNELWVHDKDVLAQISQPSAASAPDLWQFYTLSQQGFSAVTPFVTLSGQAETDFMVFRNPTNSTITVKLHDIDYIYNKGEGIAVVRIYHAPTISVLGTTVPIQKRYIGGVISPQALVYRQPTITSKGTLIRVFGTSAVSSYTHESHLAWILPPNTNILFTVQPAANNTDHLMYCDWAEFTP